MGIYQLHNGKISVQNIVSELSRYSTTAKVTNS